MHEFTAPAPLTRRLATMPQLPTPAPFGSWDSPLSIDSVTAAGLRISAPRIDSRHVYWKETGPDGLGVLRRVWVAPLSDGATPPAPPPPGAEAGAVEDLPATFQDGSPVDIGSRVHEYGGPDFAVAGDIVVFSSRRDNRLHLTARSEAGWSVPRPITPDDGTRYADLTLQGGRVYAVAERHFERQEPANMIVAVEIGTGRVDVLHSGPDFVANPRPNPSATALAWYEWNHPHMPWDTAALRVAELAGGSLGRVVHVAGGAAVGKQERTHGPGPAADPAASATDPATSATDPAAPATDPATDPAASRAVAAISPTWLSDTELVFIQDPTGWWNPFRCTDPLGAARIRPLHPAAAEYSPAPWQFDGALTPLDAEHVVVRWSQHGHWSLGTVRLANGESEEWMTGLEPASEIAAGDGLVAFVGGGPTAPAALVALDLAAGRLRLLRDTAPRILPEDAISIAEPLTWGTGPTTAHGFFYPPTNPRHTGLPGELPPVLVLVHSGPTSATSATFSPFVQFFTTRGFALLDVNYRGSTGYGRAYREALYGNWGVVDIVDVAAGVAALAERGLVDGSRALIRGSSAGGYTVLRALTTTDAFAAGTSRYGVADLALLAADTHKFESHYTEQLVGPWPEAAARYRERSPLFALESLRAPVLLLHGEDDPVVPVSQTTALAAGIRAAGGRVELVSYPGEGHGFRTAAVAQDALARELAFYREILRIP